MRGGQQRPRGRAQPERASDTSALPRPAPGRIGLCWPQPEGQLCPTASTPRGPAPRGAARRAWVGAAALSSTPQGAAAALGWLWRSLALQFIVGNHEKTAIVTEPMRNYSSSDGSQRGTAAPRPLQRGAAPPWLLATSDPNPASPGWQGRFGTERCKGGTERVLGAGAALGWPHAAGREQRTRQCSAAPQEGGGTPRSRSLTGPSGGCAWPRCCSRVSRVKNEPFLQKSLRTLFQPSLPPPSLPQPICLPRPSHCPAAPPTVTPTSSCLPPPRAALRPPGVPLPAPPLGLTLCQDLLPSSACSPRSAPQSRAGERGRWMGKGGDGGAVPIPPQSHKTNTWPAPSPGRGWGRPC